MTRIVYGVSGEGSGHSSRAREVTRQLEREGHAVKLASYDRGYRNLCDDFDVLEIEGLHIATSDNRVSVVRTFTENLARLPSGWKSVTSLRRELFDGFQPDVVLTDFEPMCAYLATHLGLPLVTLDNQHRMRYMAFECPEEMRRDARLTKAVIRAIVPRPDVSLVTTFSHGKLLNERTFLFPPILRQEILEARVERQEHVLVYFTKGFESFLELLRMGFPRERFRVYGTGEIGTDGNLDLRAPSADGFLEDLRTCKAVIASAGFTLMTECLHLGKPLLALPMHGQFEQELNAHLLAGIACGMNGRAAGRAEAAEFFYRLPEYEQSLEQQRNPGNAQLFEHLDRLLRDKGALVKTQHEERQS